MRHFFNQNLLLGGRAAEEVIFGDISTGAQNDLQRASDITRSMVMDYGMSERLGLLTYTHQQSRYLDMGLGPTDYRYRETVYHIAVLQTPAGSGEMRVTVDGVEQPDKTIPLVDDHREHKVEVRRPVTGG